MDDQGIARAGDAPPHAARGGLPAHGRRFEGHVDIPVVLAHVRGRHVNDPGVYEDLVVRDEEVVPVREHVEGLVLGGHVTHVVRVNEEAAVLSGEELGGTVREERRHRQARRCVGHIPGGRVIDGLIGRQDDGLPACDEPRPRCHPSQGLVRGDGLPGLDVDRVLRGRRRGPRGEIVDVVEHERRIRHRLAHPSNEGVEGGGHIDDLTVGADRHLRVAVLVEVEAIEADLARSSRHVCGEVLKPARMGGIDDAQEVSERVGFPRRIQQGRILPLLPLVIADAIHGRVADRPRARRPQRLDKSAHGRQGNRLVQSVEVFLSPAQQVGVPIRPVVELDTGQVQATRETGHGLDVLSRTEGGDETVAQSIRRRRAHLHGARRARRRLGDAVPANAQFSQIDEAGDGTGNHAHALAQVGDDEVTRVGGLDEDRLVGQVDGLGGEEQGSHPFTAPAVRPATK